MKLFGDGAFRERKLLNTPAIGGGGVKRLSAGPRKRKTLADVPNLLSLNILLKGKSGGDSQNQIYIY